MNSGFDPVVVAPGMWKIQTASQQPQFLFGGSQVPLHLGIRGSGSFSSSGQMKINRPFVPPAFRKGSGAASVKPSSEGQDMIDEIQYILAYLRKKSNDMSLMDSDRRDISQVYRMINDRLHTYSRRLSRGGYSQGGSKEQALRELLAYARSFGDVGY